jgi:hypothetical protein
MEFAIARQVVVSRARQRAKGEAEMDTTKRYAAGLAGVVAALAIAAPITGASAATTPALPGSEAAAVGPTLIGSVFSGALVIQVVNGPTSDSISG